MVSTVGLILKMTIEGNRAGYSISAQDFFAEMGFAASEAPKKQTVSDARAKLQWQGFEFLLKESRRSDLEDPWLGHPVQIVDGTKLTMPNSDELTEHFATPNTKSGPGFYPQAWMVTVINSTSAQPIAARVGCHKESERDLMLGLLDECRANEVLLLDRGLGGARVYLNCIKRDIFFIHRAKTSGDRVALYVQDFIASGKKSALYGVEAADDDGENVLLWVRLIEGPLDSEGKRIVFVTSLLDKKKYSVGAIRELYRRRWGIETAYDRVKNLLYLEKFHARSYNCVMQEIFANLLVMSLSAAIDLQASKNLELDRDESAPSFKAVVHVVRRYFSVIAAFEKISMRKASELEQQMIEEAGLILYKKRPGRSYPRVSKQPIKSHNLCKRKKFDDYKKSTRVK
jgi:hypothetical protein